MRDQCELAVGAKCAAATPTVVICFVGKGPGFSTCPGRLLFDRD